MTSVRVPPALPEEEHQPPIAGRILGYGLGVAFLFLSAFAITLGVRDNDLTWATATAIAIAAVAIASVVFVLALWVSAIFDVLSFSEEDTWITAGYVRWVWVGVTVWVGPLGALLWYVAVRPRMVAAERSIAR